MQPRSPQLPCCSTCTGLLPSTPQRALALPTGCGTCEGGRLCPDPCAEKQVAPWPFAPPPPGRPPPAGVCNQTFCVPLWAPVRAFYVLGMSPHLMLPMGAQIHSSANRGLRRLGAICLGPPNYSHRGPWRERRPAVQSRSSSPLRPGLRLPKPQPSAALSPPPPLTPTGSPCERPPGPGPVPSPSHLSGRPAVPAIQASSARVPGTTPLTAQTRAPTPSPRQVQLRRGTEQGLRRVPGPR